jgi:hypothetical protein
MCCSLLSQHRFKPVVDQAAGGMCWNAGELMMQVKRLAALAYITEIHEAFFK